MTADINAATDARIETLLGPVRAGVQTNSGGLAALAERVAALEARLPEPAEPEPPNDEPPGEPPDDESPIFTTAADLPAWMVAHLPGAPYPVNAPEMRRMLGPGGIWPIGVRSNLRVRNTAGVRERAAHLFRAPWSGPLTSMTLELGVRRPGYLGGDGGVTRVTIHAVRSVEDFRAERWGPALDRHVITIDADRIDQSGEALFFDRTFAGAPNLVGGELYALVFTAEGDDGDWTSTQCSTLHADNQGLHRVVQRRDWVAAVDRGRGRGWEILDSSYATLMPICVLEIGGRRYGNGAYGPGNWIDSRDYTFVFGPGEAWRSEIVLPAAVELVGALVTTNPAEAGTFNWRLVVGDRLVDEGYCTAAAADDAWITQRDPGRAYRFGSTFPLWLHSGRLEAGETAHLECHVESGRWRLAAQTDGRAYGLKPHDAGLVTAARRMPDGSWAGCVSHNHAATARIGGWTGTLFVMGDR